MPQAAKRALQAMQTIQWRWADRDAGAKDTLTTRIIETGRRRQLITYSDLVAGVTFHVPTINGGAPYSIDVSEWEGLDRALIGEFLGAISVDSYKAGQFFATALVVGKGENRPSDHFFEWMEMIGLLPNLKEDTVLAFWAQQVILAHEYYKHYDHH